MISPYKMYSRWISKLQAYKQRNGFDGEETAVYIVAQEEVVGVGAEAPDSEDLNQVEELPVYVAHHGDRCRDVHHVTLLHQKLFRLGAYCFDDGIRKQLFLVQSLDAFIQVDAG